MTSPDDQSKNLSTQDTYNHDQLTQKKIKDDANDSRIKLQSDKPDYYQTSMITPKSQYYKK